MIYKLYDDPANLYLDWIPRPAFYENRHQYLITTTSWRLKMKNFSSEFSKAPPTGELG